MDSSTLNRMRCQIHSLISLLLTGHSLFLTGHPMMTGQRHKPLATIDIRSGHYSVFCHLTWYDLINLIKLSATLPFMPSLDNH